MSLRSGRRQPHPDAPHARRTPITLPKLLARQVRRGAKTTVREPVDPAGEPYPRRVGDPAVVQVPRGKNRTVCRVIISAIEQQRLGDLTVVEARTEGFRTTEEFYAWWRARHALGLAPPLRDLLERLVDAPTALLAAHLHPGLTPMTVARRLGRLARAGYVVERAGEWDITDAGVALLIDPLEGIDLEQRVWVLTLRPDDRDVPHLLAPAARPAGSETGYVEHPALALPDTGEEPRELDPHWQREGRARHVEAMLSDPASRPVFARRLRDLIR